MSAITVAAAGAAVALAVPAIAGTNELPPGSASTLGASGDGVDPDIIMAMQRDFSLTAEQASTRIRKERSAAKTESTLRAQIGTQFSGAWLTPDGSKLVVGVTSDTAAAKVRAAGAEPKLVTTAESDLNRIKQGLDQQAKHANKTISGWYVDVTTASVVISTKPGGEAAAQALLTASGLTGADAKAVRVVATEQTPVTLADVRGADAYYINNSARCSIGFAVTGGFVTAGHCGDAGATTAGVNNVAQGSFKSSSFPGNDYAYVAVNSNWTPVGVVNDYKGGTIAVAGSEEAAVGASICRSGSTTGTHCGVVQAKNSTVNYAEGTVNGLTRTNVCAEPGDSGGSWLSGSQAQGVTSGGSGDCTSGGTTYFQPVSEILSALNLTLVTSGGGSTPTPTPTASSAKPSATASSAKPTATASSAKPTATASSAKPSATASSAKPTPTASSARPTTPPTTPSATGSQPGSNQPSPPQSSAPGTNPPAACTSMEASADGTLSGTGAQLTVPSAGYFRAKSGQHAACLSGPSTANFNLYLQRWNGRKWQTVATAASAGAGEDETLTYTGAAGYYRYRLVSASGSGPYLVTADIP